MFSCRPILFYVLYVTFIHDKLLSNAVYIVCNTVARPTSLRIGKNLSQSKCYLADLVTE